MLTGRSPSGAGRLGRHSSARRAYQRDLLLGLRHGRSGDAVPKRASVIYEELSRSQIVFVRVPEGELMTAVRGAECFIDVEDLLFLWLHGAAELIDKRRGQPSSFDFARRVLQA